MNELRHMASEQHVSVFALTESWLTKSHKDSENIIDGYHVYRNDRTPKQWGTLIYVRQGLSAQRQYKELDIPSDVYIIAGKGLRSFIVINNYMQCDSTDAWIHTYFKNWPKISLV